VPESNSSGNNRQNQSPSNEASEKREKTKNEQTFRGKIYLVIQTGGFIAFVAIGILFAISIIFFGIYYQKGTYEGYVVARYWGIVSFIFAGIGLWGAYEYYIVQPAKAVEHQVEAPPDRPWLSVDVVADGDITFAPDGSATFPFKFTANNSGKIPANRARLTAEMICPKANDDQLLIGANKRLREISEQTDAQRADFFDFGTIFPGKDSVEDVVVGLHLDAPAMAAQFSSLSSPESRKWLFPWLVGCITYNFEANGHEFTGKTGFVYEISRTIPNKPGTRGMRIGENVPKNEIVMRKPWINGDFAK
jgi:hypothetical protein